MQKVLDIYLEKVLFDIGHTYITNGVDSLMDEDGEFRQFVSHSFTRHCSGDWGDLDDEDKQTNEWALKNGERLFSKYNYNDDVSIYIITEWDRSVTTILFPEEY